MLDRNVLTSARQLSPLRNSTAASSVTELVEEQLRRHYFLKILTAA